MGLVNQFLTQLVKPGPMQKAVLKQFGFNKHLRLVSNENIYISFSNFQAKFCLHLYLCSPIDSVKIKGRKAGV